MIIKIQIGSLKKYTEIFKIEYLLEIKIEPKK